MSRLAFLIAINDSTAPKDEARFFISARLSNLRCADRVK
jgi:hypothetical protein